MKEGDPIFGDSGFELGVEDVAEIREQVAENVRVTEEMLTDEDERVRVAAERGQESVRREADFFGQRADEAILEIVRSIFERGRALEATGVPALDVATTVEQEIPDTLTVYGILRKNPWGYRLGQLVMAAGTIRKETK